MKQHISTGSPCSILVTDALAFMGLKAEACYHQD